MFKTKKEEQLSELYKPQSIEVKLSPQEGNKEYEIDKEKLEIDINIKNKVYEDLEIFLKEMKKYIKNENKDLCKYSLYCLRVQINDKNSLNNKSFLSEELQKRDFISDILNLFQKYIDFKRLMIII